MTEHPDRIHDDVRNYYRRAAQTGDVSEATDERWGTARYDDDALESGGEAAALSMGCGNPVRARRPVAR